MDPPHSQTAEGAGFYQAGAGGTHEHGGGGGCTDALLPGLSPLYRHGQALSSAQPSQTDCCEARNLSSPSAPLDWLLPALAKGGLRMQPKSPRLKSIIRAAQITRACLERLKTHPHFTEVPAGMRWFSRCLFLQSILGILFPLKHTSILISRLFCTEATSFLFVENGGDEHRLTNNHHHAILCYCTNPGGTAVTRAGLFNFQCL